jgi:Family of unknown function (DUF6065)
MPQGLLGSFGCGKELSEWVPPRLLRFVMKVAVVPAPVCTAPSQAKVPFAFGGGGGGEVGGAGGDAGVDTSIPWVTASPPVEVLFAVARNTSTLSAGACVQPELRPLSDDLALEHQHETWMASRNQFNAELRRPGSQAQADKWQKLYYQGTDMEGRTIASDHRTRLRVKPFAK